METYVTRSIVCPTINCLQVVLVSTFTVYSQYLCIDVCLRPTQSARRRSFLHADPTLSAAIVTLSRYSVPSQPSPSITYPLLSTTMHTATIFTLSWYYCLHGSVLSLRRLLISCPFYKALSLQPYPSFQTRLATSPQAHVGCPFVSLSALSSQILLSDLPLVSGF